MAKGWLKEVECAYCPNRGNTKTFKYLKVEGSHQYVCPTCEVTKHSRAKLHIRRYRALVRQHYGL